MEFDPAAAWWIAPVEVTIAGRIYRIPALPAVDWMTLLHGDYTWLDIVPGLLHDDSTDLDDDLESGRVTHDDLVDAAKNAVEAAAGVRWWTALRLVHAAGPVGGDLALAGLDLSTTPFAAALHAVYRIYVRHADEQTKIKIDRELTKLPDGVRAHDAYNEDQASAAFEETARARGNP